MSFPVVYRRGASDDIDEAVRWLGERSPAAAIDFLRAIVRAETHLKRTPLIYQTVHADIRRAHLKPFRYGLYFRVVEERVLVIACLHANRSPTAIGNVLRDRR